MRLSLFVELITPRPWEEDSEYKKIQEALEQVELADKYGFSTVWVVEHHFLEEYAHSTAPESFLAAASQRTKNIRLGHGIMNILPPINHPFRAAERAATLDLLSGGRVELGTGEGSSVSEIGGFNIDPGIKKQMWEESLGVMIESLTQEPFPGIAGEFLQLPPRNVVPKPFQKPHPPLWMAATRRERILEAAQKGLGALCFFFSEPESSREWVDAYYKTLIEECVPVGLVPSPNLAMTSWTMCCDDRGEAALRSIEHIDFFRWASKHYYSVGPHSPGVTNVWELYQKSGDAEASRARAQKIADGEADATGVAVGTPEDVTAYLERYEAAGVDEILLGMQTGRIKHEHIMESIELLGEKVLPAFIERHEKAEKEKQKRLEPHIEAAIKRRPPQRKAPEGYSHDVVLRAWEDGRKVGGMRESMEIQWQVSAGLLPDVRPDNWRDFLDKS